MSDYTPDDVAASPAQRRRISRYDRPRRYVSWFGLFLGLALGIGGGLYYAWNVAPVEEVDILPWQLNETDRNHYLAAVMVRYSYSGDLNETIQELVALRLGDNPIDQVASIACNMARSNYVSTNSGIRAVRAMIAFYQGQGKTGCADTILPAEAAPTQEIILVLPTPTLRPPATKTPTPQGTGLPSSTPRSAASVTPTPSRDFEIAGRNTFCDSVLSGIIEVTVADFNGRGIPGMPVRVRWNGGESNFFTGLKPERGPGYADFEMEPGISYIIEMPGLSNPSTTPIVANECNLEEGGTAITSYRVVFRGG